ncbi:hypothetical protein PYCCODRAFT_1480382 [Trametes coccinea BRFM310]|uniref:CFEM domain-containing protein n=1 Tax=Trametes coccinea (strain BRFM310) TaxID=1353009 RepID=A0A1Y2IFZ9_TRAC3|nr:hypothetical protein PYCCODRAFT_1480382 [Trametes coccinea BRFM310]
MLASLQSVSLVLLLLSFQSAPVVNAAASLTPPQESSSQSSSGSVGLSASFTPLSSAASGSGAASGSASGNGSATATSSAQFPSLSGLSDCATQCFGLAVSQDGCTSLVDVNCYCRNTTRFTTGLVACISTQCRGDLASVESIAEQFCAQAATSTFLSFPTPPPTTTFSNPFTSSTSASGSVSGSGNGSSATFPSSSATSSSAPTSSSGAGQGNHAMATGPLNGAIGIFGLVVSLAGVALA